MAINPGLLRTYATLQAMTEVPDPYGQLVQGWEDLGPVWLYDRVPSGRDLVVAESLGQVRNHIIAVRYDPRITPTCRFLLGDRVLRIVEVLPNDQNTWLLNVVCVEVRDEDPAGDPVPGEVDE